MRLENAQWSGWLPARLERLCRMPVIVALTGVALAGSLVLGHPRVASAGRLLVNGPVGASVTLDGRAIGTLPLPAPLALEPGTYVLRCELDGYRPFEVEALVGGDRTEYVVVAHMEPFERSAAFANSLIFAGLGQHYLNRPRLGWTLTAIEAGGLAAGVAGEILLRSRSSDYEELYDAYQHAISEPDVAAKKDAAEESWNQVEDAANLRKTGFIVAGCALAVGVLDAMLRFPGVEAGPTGMQASDLGASGAGHGASIRAPSGLPGLRIAWRAHF